MALTQTEIEESIETLERALALGETRVDFKDRSVSYRSVDDLKKAIDYFKGLLTDATGGRPRQSIAVASSGFCP